MIIGHIRIAFPPSYSDEHGFAGSRPGQDRRPEASRRLDSRSGLI